MILLNGVKVEIKKFPNGETLINNLKDYRVFADNKYHINMFVKFESDEDLIHMMFIKRHLDEMNIDVELEIPYLPYSRMDRTEGLNVFTLKYLSKMINDLNFKKVIIHEPHSDVSVALIDRCKVVHKTLELLEDAKTYIKFNENDYIFFPDQGAEKRYSKHIKSSNVLTGIKERDFATGRIKKLDIVGEKPNKDFRVVIIDDLCSRGGTFMLSAEKLRDIGAKEIYLVVAHCEDTIFDGDILKTDSINKVFTTNSILNRLSEKIIVEDLI